MKEGVVNFSDLVHFFPKQVEATNVADKYKYTLFGGSAGPGKSYWLRWYAIRALINWHKKTGLRGIRAGLFCEDYPSLKDRHISKMQYEFPSWLGEIKDSQADGLAFHLASSFGGGILALRNLDNPSKYLSSEFALIAIDELTMNEKNVFDMLRLRLRWTGIEDARFIAGTNPGNKGHVWVKKMWMDGEFELEEKEANEFVYVKALPSDNPHLAESYKVALQSLPERLRKAYWEGDWNIFEGQYFTEWSEGVHVVEPFTVPESWKKVRGIDHGRNKPTACLWGAIDYNGTLWIYREYYMAGVDADINAQEIAKRGFGENYLFTVLDSSCFSRTGSGETIAEIYARNGVMAEPSHKDRIAGWTLFHEYLRHSDITAPKMRVFSTCPNTIHTIPTLQHDNRRPEDVDTNGEDHAADAISYVLQSLHEMKSPAPQTLIEKRLQQFRSMHELTPNNFNRFYGGAH